MEAYPIAFGWYRLKDERKGETYRLKQQIKAAGGQWSVNGWVIPPTAMEALSAKKMTRVIMAAYCHAPEEPAWATPSEIAKGTKLIGCQRCDTPISCGAYAQFRISDEQESEK